MATTSGRDWIFTHAFSQSSFKTYEKNGLARRDTVHPRVFGAGGRYQPGDQTRDAGAGSADRRARHAVERALGQRARVYFATDAGLGRGAQDQPGPYPAGSSHAERPCGELPRTVPRRVPERKLVPHSQRCAPDAGGMAPGLQLRASAQFAWLQDPTGVRGQNKNGKLQLSLVEKNGAGQSTL